MESFVRTSSATCLVPNIRKSRSGFGVASDHNAFLKAATGFHFPSLNFEKNPLISGLRKSFIVEAKKSKNKVDKHSFVPRPDEATGPFPEAVLLKERKIREDGRRLPDFADAEEEKLFEYLQLQIEKKLKTECMRHYEVVYLIHEKHEEEVANVKEKIQEFMREKKAKIWRLNDWGMRRLAYKIQKAKRAYYVLMNFELDAKWINDFKGMLDKDERVIRHLVMKKKHAETKDCPPPPEFHTLRGYTYAEDLDENDEDIDGATLDGMNDSVVDDDDEDFDGTTLDGMDDEDFDGMALDGMDDEDFDGEDDLTLGSNSMDDSIIDEEHDDDNEEYDDVDVDVDDDDYDYDDDGGGDDGGKKRSPRIGIGV